MTDPARPTRPARSETREVIELRSIGEAHPELADAVDMQIELLGLQRRVQGRVPLPWFELNEEIIRKHDATGQPLLRFENITIESSDLRLLMRQIADVLRRHGSLEEKDYERIQVIGRDMNLLEVALRWYRSGARHHSVAAVGLGHDLPAVAQESRDEALDQVMSLALRPWMTRCAEVLQQRTELALWSHPHCALCGSEPDFSVITPAAERHLICSRCTLRWKFEPLTCPYCRNNDRSRITSFATPDGQYRVYACDHCHRYLKAYDGRRATRPVMPVVDSVATLPLDAYAMQRGYS
ncbi:MAG TPA: formate dehydrogenase accessory protein FdhE [Vicinamibacterales bacterium]|nr:formate dehydrogenase accessory protein FdhE [Vicinamibacterales bacterium]